MRIIHRTKKIFFLQICALLTLLFLFAACSNAGGNNGQTLNSTPGSGTASSPAVPTLTPTPAIHLGPQACPVAVQNTSYWDALIPTQPAVSKVESVTCGYLKGVPLLQALVAVRYEGTGEILDVYVYDNLNGATPTQLFKLPNLYKGDAKISGYNTVVTAEVDQASSVNNNRPDAALTQDLFREFKWSDGADTLVQVSFSGIYPDLTRYQAEEDQAQVNQGHEPWKLSATATAQELGTNLLHWDANATATIASGGGNHDVQAVVNLRNTAPGSNTIQLTMARLEQNTNGGIWIVTAVSTSGLGITGPQSAALIHSPATITGTGNAFEGVIGTATVLDHLYSDLGHTTVHGATGTGSTTFSTLVTYHPTFKAGAEEGLLLLTTENNAGGPASGAAIVKVLIQ